MMFPHLKTRRQLSPHRLIHACALVAVLLFSLEDSIIGSSEAKEFDWNDLGVSLASAKSSSSPAGNLRILVSPQRRSTKNYEFEYTNGSQPQSIAANQGDSSYVVASSGGSPYLTQSVYQLAPNHTSGHSSAYSALSASLASLKSRLNARGVTLTSTIADPNSQPSSHLYASTNNNAYGSSVIIEPAQQQQQPSQQQQQAQAQQQSSQPAAYLSVSSQQDSQASSPYTVPPSQGSENKTIVLAIPAKINFLTGSKQASSQQQQQQQHQQQSISQQPSQQAQQLSVLQSTGILNGQEGSVEQVGQMAAAEPQEHQQYVIVNQPQSYSDHHSHSVAASMSPTPVISGGQVYSTIYQPQAIAQTAGGFAMKYLPAFSQATAQVQQPAVQKVYSVIESPQQQMQQQMQPQPQQQQMQPQQQMQLQPQMQPQSLIQPQQQQMQPQPQQMQPQQQQMQPAQQVAPMTSTAYETQMVDQAPVSGTRYISCIDTCNSADPRWRKYTVSRYKACCSRSSQYDTSFEQPSMEKVGEMSTRYADDAYYSYLQKRVRPRRPRRQRSRQYPRYSLGSSSFSSASSSSQQDDEPADYSGSAADSLGAGRSSSAGRQAYHETPSYSSKYYKSRGYGSSGAAASADMTGAEPMGRDEALPPAPASQGGKYAAKEPRAGRRGRSRDYGSSSSSSLDSPVQQMDDNVEDGSVYPREPSAARGAAPSSSSSSLASSSGGYGNGEYSVDLQGRGYGSDTRSNGDEDEPTRYDEPADMEPSSGKGGGSEAQDYSSETTSEANDESEPESATGAAYKYPTTSGYGGGGSNNRKKPSKPRRKPAPSKEQTKTYSYGSSSGTKKASGGKKNKSRPDNHASNATDYDSAQPGAGSGSSDYYQDSSSSSSSNGAQSQDQEDHGASSSSYATKESSPSYENSESEKESHSGAKYRASLNETAVANLSKTTMHLKEILSILEKKAQSRGNDSLFANHHQQQQQQPPQQQSQQPPVTSTSLPPITTTTSSYPLSLLSAGSPYSSSLTSDFFSSDFGSFGKSPYKFDQSSFSSGSLGSPPMSLPSSFGSFGSESMSPLTPPYPSPYSLHTGKPMGNPNGGPHQRKRRVNKNARYNELMLQKAAHSLVTPSSLMHAKNRFLSPSYYSALQYPYLYRGATQSLTNPYPYKSHHKNPYSSLLSGSMSSKLAAAANSGGLYSDESRLHGLTSLDPLANMASSLRPSAAMRLRSKPFIFQPQVLPIYTRHSILTQPLEGKA